MDEFKVLIFGGRTFGLQEDERRKAMGYLCRLSNDFWPRLPEDPYETGCPT
jgi:hypothetical protein